MCPDWDAPGVQKPAFAQRDQKPVIMGAFCDYMDEKDTGVLSYACKLLQYVLRLRTSTHEDYLAFAPPRRPIYEEEVSKLPSRPPYFNAAWNDYVPDFADEKTPRGDADEPESPLATHKVATMDHDGHLHDIDGDELSSYQFMADSDDVFGCPGQTTPQCLWS